MDLDKLVSESIERLGLEPIDWQRHISAEDLLYLLDHCPFLKITAIDGGTPAPLKIFPSNSGWNIHYSGDIIESSPGELLFNHGLPGKGTIVNQTVVTGMEMIELAQKMGWKSIQIIDGHPLMAWAAWMEAQDLGLAIEGYVPTQKDYEKRKRVLDARAHKELIRPTKKPQK